jgi:regulator of sigma E protease
MLGGVMMNFILALFIYILVLYAWGESYVPADRLEYGLRFDNTLIEMGFRDGDNIVALDGKKVVKWRSIHHDIVVNEAKVVQVERDGQLIDIHLPDDMVSRLLKIEYAMAPRVICGVKKLADGGLKDAGARNGDLIISVNGTPIRFYHEFTEITKRARNTTFDLGILRGTDTLQMRVTTNDQGLFGFQPLSDYDIFEPEIIKYSFLQSIPAGIKHGVSISRSYLKQLSMLLKPKTRAYEELGGFIKIGSIFPPTWDWESFWNMTAFLSIILAIMNVLPIPALDGGHVMFTLFEMITGRKPGDKFLEYAQIVGMVILLSLLLYANLNDIIGLFNK